MKDNFQYKYSIINQNSLLGGREEMLERQVVDNVLIMHKNLNNLVHYYDWEMERIDSDFQELITHEEIMNSKDLENSKLFLTRVTRKWFRLQLLLQRPESYKEMKRLKLSSTTR